MFKIKLQFIYFVADFFLYFVYTQNVNTTVKSVDFSKIVMFHRRKKIIWIWKSE